jgi:hypothetical protein
MSTSLTTTVKFFHINTTPTCPKTRPRGPSIPHSMYCNIISVTRYVVIDNTNKPTDSLKGFSLTIIFQKAFVDDKYNLLFYCLFHHPLYNFGGDKIVLRLGICDSRPPTHSQFCCFIVLSSFRCNKKS